MKVWIVYREILRRRFEERVSQFTQRGLAASCYLSLGLVNHALKPLRRMGAVVVRERSLELLDPWKVLLYWCSVRNLQGDEVYSTHVDEPVTRIEASLPSRSIPTAYTAYKENFKDAPSDYSEVYTYGDRDEFAERYGSESRTGWQNLIVLRVDNHLLSLGRAPMPQVYVDLWNLDTWYARRYLTELGRKLRESVPEGAP